MTALSRMPCTTDFISSRSCWAMVKHIMKLIFCTLSRSTCILIALINTYNPQQTNYFLKRWLALLLLPCLSLNLLWHKIEVAQQLDTCTLSCCDKIRRPQGLQIGGDSRLEAAGNRSSPVLMAESTLFCLPDEVLVSIVKELDCVKSLQNLAIAGIRTVKHGNTKHTNLQVSRIAREMLRKRFNVLCIEPNHASLDRVRAICSSPDHAKEITELRWIATLQQRTWQEVMSRTSSSRHTCADVPASVLGVVLNKHEILRQEQEALIESGEFDQALQACVRRLPLRKISIVTDPWLMQHFPDGHPNPCNAGAPCTYMKIDGVYNRPKYWRHSHAGISVEEELDQSASIFQENELLYKLHYGPRTEPFVFDTPFRLFRAIFAARKQFEFDLVFAGHLDLLTRDRINTFRTEYPIVYDQVMSMISAVTIQLDNARYAYDPDQNSRRAMPWLQFLWNSNVTKLTVRGISRTHEEFLNRLITNFDGTRTLGKLTSLHIWFPDRWHYACENRIVLDSLLSVQPYTTMELWRFLAAHKSTLRDLTLYNCLGCDQDQGTHVAEDLRRLLRSIKQQLHLSNATIIITLSVWFDVLDVRAMDDEAAGVSLVPRVVSNYPPPFWNLQPLPQGRDRAREADSELGQLARRLKIDSPREYHAHRCSKIIKVGGRDVKIYLWPEEAREDQMYFDYDFGSSVLGDDDFAADTDPESDSESEAENDSSMDDDSSQA
nr:hypothetical protein CFP56_10284 [Quercus suber]